MTCSFVASKSRKPPILTMERLDTSPPPRTFDAGLPRYATGIFLFRWTFNYRCASYSCAT